MNTHLILYQNKFNYIRPLLKRLLLLIFILLCINFEALSQSYPFRHFTAKDGLPTSETYHVFQDSKGYIWIATDNGVSKYDGYEFKIFTAEDGLPDNTVFEIIEDHKGRIWFMPHSINLSYYLNDSIYHYKFNDKIQSYLKGNSNPNKLMFYIDSKDNIYFRDKKNNALYIIDSLGNISTPGKNMNQLWYFVKDNKLLQGNVNRKIKFNPYLYSIIEDSIKIYQGSFDPKIEFGMKFGIKKDDSYFIVHGNNIIHIKDSAIFCKKNFPVNIIWMNIDSKNNLWLGTNNGAYVYNDLNIGSKGKHFLKNKSISSVLEDREGGYWFSSLQNGLYYLPNIASQNFNVKDGLKSEVITTVEKDSSTIWIGSNNNYVQGIESGKVNKEIKLDKSAEFIYDIFYDKKEKKLWIASSSLYLFKNNVLRSFFTIEDFPENYTNVQIRDLAIDKNNDLWIASYDGLHKLSNNYLKYSKLKGSNYRINTINQKTNDVFLLGCNNGLWEYSISTKEFLFLGNKKLLESKILCIEQNNFHNNFWIGSSSNGIIVYDPDSIYNITTENGLSSNNITSFFIMDTTIWVATKNGLNKISLNSKVITNDFSIESFYTTHGLASNEINDIYVNDSMAYIATHNGLSVIDHNRMKLNSFPPPVYIKSIQIQDKDTIIKKHYDLPYNHNSLNIEFIGLMYRNIENKKYKYRLNQSGNQANWIETPDNHVNLSFLSPGKYNFEVIAINEDDYESSVPATLSLTIKPPYWKTWWFVSSIILLSLFVILSILFVIYKIRINEINRRNALEKKLMQEINKFRQQALSQQMNPHFIFNTLNAIQYYIFENDNISSTRYLAKFSKLMRLILDNSQHDTITIFKELDTLELYMELESLRTEGKFDYEIKIDKNLDPSLYHISPMLIQPYVENSIWHGITPKKTKGKIKIDFQLNLSSILCIIEDDGIGREKAMELKKQKKSKHKSHGTNITNRRIELINKLYNKNFKVEFIDLKNENGIGCGTKVILQIPKIFN